MDRCVIKIIIDSSVCSRVLSESAKESWQGLVEEEEILLVDISFLMW